MRAPRRARRRSRLHTPCSTPRASGPPPDADTVGSAVCGNHERHPPADLSQGVHQDRDAIEDGPARGEPIEVVPVPRIRHPPSEVAFDDGICRANDRIDAPEKGVADQCPTHDTERPGNADRSGKGARNRLLEFLQLFLTAAYREQHAAAQLGCQHVNLLGVFGIVGRMRHGNRSPAGLEAGHCRHVAGQITAGRTLQEILSASAPRTRCPIAAINGANPSRRHFSESRLTSFSIWAVICRCNAERASTKTVTPSTSVETVKTAT